MVLSSPHLNSIQLKGFSIGFTVLDIGDADVLCSGCARYDGEFNGIINHIMFIQRDSPQITFLGIMWDKTTCACKRKWCLHIIITKVSFCLSWKFSAILYDFTPSFSPLPRTLARQIRLRLPSTCYFPCSCTTSKSRTDVCQTMHSFLLSQGLDSFRKEDNFHSPWISQKEHPTTSSIVHKKCLDQSVIQKMLRMEISMETKQSELNLLVFSAPPGFFFHKELIYY